MDKKQYTEYRAKLVKEANELKKNHCHLSAKARIRKIAKLDYEEKGIDIETTKKNFKYNEL